MASLGLGGKHWPQLRLKQLLSSIVHSLLFTSVRRTILLLLIIVLIPELVIEVSHYRAMFVDRRSQALEADLEMARSVGLSFGTYLDHITHDELTLGLALASPLPADQANRLLALSAARNPAVISFRWINPQGNVIASSDPNLIGRNLSNWTYFQEIAVGEEWVVSDLLPGPSDREASFAVVQSVRDESGTLKGAVAALIDSQQLGEAIKMERAGDASGGLIDRQGRIVYRFPEVDLTWDQRDVRVSQEFISPALRGEEVSGTFATAPDGRKRMSAYVPAASTGWVAGAGRPEEEVMAPVVAELLRESSLRILTTLLAVFVAMVIGRSITVPIRRVRDHALAIGRGEPGQALEITGPGELTDLAEAFNRMDAEVRHREEVLQRYQLLSMHARDAMLFVRHDGQIIEANEAAIRAYGYQREELLSLKIGDLRVHSSEQVATSLGMGAGSDGVLFEAVDRRKDGSTFPVEVTSQGAIMGGERVYLSIVRDCSKRREAEKDIKLRSDLLDAASDSVFLHDRDMDVLYVNEAAYKSRGYSREELLSTGLRSLIAPEYLQERKLRLRELLRTGEMTFESEHICKDGSVMPVEVHNRVLELDGTKLILSVIRDITERKRTEQVMLAQFKQFAAIFDSINALVYVADLKTHELLHLNRYGAELFGADSLGKPCYEVLQSGQAARCPFCTNDRLVKDGVPEPPYVWEFQNTVTGRWFLCIDRAIAWDDGRLVRMEVAVDITDRKRADQFREQYVYAISHDLRNPLGAVQGLAQFLVRKLEKAGLNGSEAQSAKGIITSAERMNSIIQDLLDSMHLEAGQFVLEKQPVDLRSCISDLLERSVNMTGDRRVNLDIPEDLPPVLADPGRLERILTNLLTNALKYSPPETEVAVRAVNAGEEVTVSVTDLGSGIGPEDLPHIFDRFYRSERTRKLEGVGLGLHITKMLVEAHSGRIWVDSQLDKGSTFHFSLPGA